MHKHPNIAVNTLPYTLAAYPLEYKQSVISPQKICIQFSGVQCKARAPFSKEGLRRSKYGSWELPVDTRATDLDCLALGIPLRLYPEVLKNILNNIKLHAEQHPKFSIVEEIKEIINGF